MMRTNFNHTARRWLMAVGAGIALLALILIPGSRAQVDIPEVDESMQEAEEGAGLFQVVRIELALFGGLMSGDDYLRLPNVQNENLTFDTGAVDIVDFSGEPRDELRAPLKYIQNGKLLGGTASFYLGPNFGMQLQGSWTRADAFLTGHGRNNTERFIADRSEVDIIAVGGNIIYNLGKEQKQKWFGIRPFVNLGFGGVLTKFPRVDDVGAVYFQYGGGFSYPIYQDFRVELASNWKLYTYDTDEVARDQVVQFPSLTLGFAWRYDVPPADSGIEPPADAEIPAPEEG